MCRKKKKVEDDEYIPLSPDFPPVPPPAPEGGWIDPPRAKVENLHDPPKGGFLPPIPDDPIDIRRLELLVGKITFAKSHPSNPESLVLTYVNVGEPFPRPIVSEIGKFYTKADLEKRKVVALCNLEPMEMRNIGNTAMLMCATAQDENGEFRHELWDPPADSKVGETVLCEGYPLLPELTSAPELPYMHRDEDIYDKVVADLRVNSEREVVYKDSHRLFVKNREGFVTTKSLADCDIKTTHV